MLQAQQMEATPRDALGIVQSLMGEQGAKAGAQGLVLFTKDEFCRQVRWFTGLFFVSKS